MTLIGELAALVAGAQASALPSGERERLHLHLTDTVMAALAGASIPEGRALENLGAAGGRAERIGRRAAAIRLTEIDDIHLPSCTTPSAGIVPVALALAAATENFDPDELAGAMWAATALMTRLGMALGGPQILYRGIWPTYLLAPIAAAGCAARLFALDEARIAHALSLAFMLMAGGVGRIHGAPSGRWFLYGHAVAAGIAAAEAARADYRGDLELLENNWLADTHGIALDRTRLAAGLASRAVFAELSMKPFCSAKQAIAAVEAFRSILAGDGVSAEAIEDVLVRVPPAYAGMIGTRAEPGARQSSLVSVAHQIALAALAADRLHDVDRTRPAIDPAVAAFSSKVQIVADPALEAFYPQHWPAEVEVKTAGATFRRRVVAAGGDPEHPLGGAAVDDKAHRVLDPMLGAARVDEWLGLCHAALQGRSECRRLASAFAGLDSPQRAASK